MGYPSLEAPPNSSGFYYLPWKPFSRLSVLRFLIPLKFLVRLVQLRPQVLIVNTHELLWAMWIYAWMIPGCTCIYDVRENYATNLRYQGNYPWFISQIAASYIRIKEWVTRPKVTLYFLAEKSYANQLPFVKKKHLILENKATLNPVQAQQLPLFQVIISGTLSHYSRTVAAIRCYQQLVDYLPQPNQLLVIGQVPSSQYHKRLKTMAGKHANIHMQTSNRPIPHAIIERRISESSLAIISYKPNPVNAQKVPTKLFEYRAARIPYLVQKHSYWSEVGQQLGGAIAVSIDRPDGRMVRESIPVAFKRAADQGFLWDEEADKLTAWLSTNFHSILRT